jgi:hypothetical protein
MLGRRSDQWLLGGLGPDGKQSRGASSSLDGERRKIQPFFVSLLGKTQTHGTSGLRVFNALLFPTIRSALVFAPSLRNLVCVAVIPL